MMMIIDGADDYGNDNGQLLQVIARTSSVLVGKVNCANLSHGPPILKSAVLVFQRRYGSKFCGTAMIGARHDCHHFRHIVVSQNKGIPKVPLILGNSHM